MLISFPQFIIDFFENGFIILMLTSPSVSQWAGRDADDKIPKFFWRRRDLVRYYDYSKRAKPHGFLQKHLPERLCSE